MCSGVGVRLNSIIWNVSGDSVGDVPLSGDWGLGQESTRGENGRKHGSGYFDFFLRFIQFLVYVFYSI